MPSADESYFSIHSDEFLDLCATFKPSSPCDSSKGHTLASSLTSPPALNPPSHPTSNKGNDEPPVLLSTSTSTPLLPSPPPSRSFSTYLPQPVQTLFEEHPWVRSLAIFCGVYIVALAILLLPCKALRYTKTHPESTLAHIQCQYFRSCHQVLPIEFDFVIHPDKPSATNNATFALQTHTSLCPAHLSEFAAHDSLHQLSQAMRRRIGEYVKFGTVTGRHSLGISSKTTEEIRASGFDLAAGPVFFLPLGEFAQSIGLLTANDEPLGKMSDIVASSLPAINPPGRDTTAELSKLAARYLAYVKVASARANVLLTSVQRLNLVLRKAEQEFEDLGAPPMGDTSAYDKAVKARSVVHAIASSIRALRSDIISVQAILPRLSCAVHHIKDISESSLATIS